MTHDVFISYSSKDKPIADGVCANLEAESIRCWIAPRDIAPGEDWPTAITKAISKSRTMVLVFSASSNSSEEVGRELILASNSKLIIIPFKIENIEPEPGKQYYLARTHWLDAMNPPTKDQIAILVNRVKSILPATDPVGPNQTELDGAPQSPPPSKQVPKVNWFWRRLVWIAGALAALGLFTWLVMGRAFPTFQSQYVFHDDFSNESSGWDISMDKISERRYQDGEYIMRVGPGVSPSGISKYSSTYGNCYNNWSVAGLSQLTNVAIDVDARYIGGPLSPTSYGVVFNFQAQDNYYFYQVSPAGGSTLVRRTPEGFYDQLPFQQHPAIKTGTSTNHLRIELSDPAAFYINGQLISAMHLPNQPGDIGLWVDHCTEGIFEAAFDNLVVTQLP